MSAQAPLRDVINRYDLGARKSLGQHFLLDLNLCARIARTAGKLNDTNIIEIGPGPGGLTRALLDAGAARVVAVEHDHPRPFVGFDHGALGRHQGEGIFLVALIVDQNAQ